MDYFSGYIRSISVFLILLSFVRILTPHSKYKCYIDLVLGFIMISVVVSPAAKILGGAVKPLDALLPKLNYKINSYDIKNEEYIYESRNRMILSTYTDELKKQIDTLVKPSGVYVMEDAEFTIGENEDDFGDILRIRVLLSEKDLNAAKNDISFIRIDGVKVRLPNQKAKEEELTDTDEEIIKIKNLISGFYNLSVDNIYITVRKN